MNASQVDRLAQEHTSRKRKHMPQRDLLRQMDKWDVRIHQTETGIIEDDTN